MIKNTFESVNALYEGRELTLSAFRSRIFPIKATKCDGLKIITPKQMLQRLAIALEKVMAGSTSENLLNEICQIFVKMKFFVFSNVKNMYKYFLKKYIAI